MSPPVCEWSLDDCCLFLQRIAKTFKGSISDNILEEIIESFRKNHIIGASLIAFGDKEWEQLIPSLGFRFHCRKAISEKIKEEQTEKMSKMQQRGAPKKAMRETAQITGMPKISSFFSREKSEAVLDLPEDVDLLLLPKESSEPAVQDTVVISENVQRLIEHLLAKEKRESGFSSLLLRKAILKYLELDGGQVRNCARKLCTWSQACGLKDATDENCRVRIKYYKRMADALDHINLSEHLTHFLANGTLMNIRNSGNCSSASFRLGLAPGPKPVRGRARDRAL